MLQIIDSHFRLNSVFLKNSFFEINTNDAHIQHLFVKIIKLLNPKHLYVN